VLLAEVAAAGLVAGQRVEAHQLAELEEVGDAAGLLEVLVELGADAGHADLLPEALADLGDDLQRLLEAGLVAGHAAVVPHDEAELAVELVDAVVAVDAQQAAGLGVDLGDAALETPGGRW
jgi:hypothetical protein